VRLILAISLFLGATMCFWVAFHPVRSAPSASGVLADLRTSVMTGDVPGSAAGQTGTSGSTSTAQTGSPVSGSNLVKDAEQALSVESEAIIPGFGAVAKLLGLP